MSSSEVPQKTRRTVEVDLWLGIRKQVLEASNIKSEDERKRVIHALAGEYEEAFNLIGVMLNPDGTLNEEGRAFVGVSSD